MKKEKDNSGKIIITGLVVVALLIFSLMIWSPLYNEGETINSEHENLIVSTPSQNSYYCLGVCSQSFNIEEKTITRVDFYMIGRGVVELSIVNRNTGKVILSLSEDYSSSFYEWKEFNFDAIKITTGEQYLITLSGNYDRVGWNVDDSYKFGNAQINGADRSDFDLSFKLYTGDEE